MRVGVQIRRVPKGYAVEFGASETKSGRQLAYGLHPALVPVFDAYLKDARPHLGSSRTDLLWCSTRGCPLSLKQLSKIVFRRTREWFVVAHGPHWFRKCLRSSAGRHSPEAALDAAAVLGHGAEVSVRHYTEAGSTAALRRHGQRIDNLRQRTRLLAEQFFAEREGRASTWW